ncbi:putative gastrointestinal growth factor xP1 [Xenopus tropicalis]|uniref:Gastrointestinal growth factor xP1 n=1 Tax=Xenopus tropicalis TaxID=8364 RepID=A0A6I8Q463_XENTR|nr:putative gastrointestinal growth factor xP1 [Xenopus tropicalis]|eukprot:XP_004918264.1 PREDICTED: putative gastrointestinal growth factor xP1 [Xenopus tropicalis]
MDYKLVSLLALILAVGISNVAAEFTAAQCEIEPKARINCGPPGITPIECNTKGCCFDSSIVGVIWCFYPKAEQDCFI